MDWSRQLSLSSPSQRGHPHRSHHNCYLPHQLRKFHRIQRHSQSGRRRSDGDLFHQHYLRSLAPHLLPAHFAQVTVDLGSLRHPRECLGRSLFVVLIFLGFLAGNHPGGCNEHGKHDLTRAMASAAC